ncbi:MFS transporter [Ornithinicoccus halotolerans]|uniref:MFS transporter n=1 Tax=Ornithinicoccus halotolerans TaxID=1748220 RepID=UPI001E337968|nr:MFS transporter [Ornithinicoccus halotolerans]
MSEVSEATPSRARAIFPLREVVLGAMLPSLLFSMAVGIVLPLIPSTATRLGADLAAAGFVAALLPIGKIAADLPAGAVAARIGDRRAMLLAAVLSLLAFAGTAAAPSLLLLQLSIFALGVATAVFHLSRHAFLTEVTPVGQRARVLSTLGGMHRLGYFVGPFLGALVIVSTSLRPAFWLATGCVLVMLIVLLMSRDDTARSTSGNRAPKRSLLQIAVDYRRLFLTLGVATLLVGAVRGARQTVLPLWGESLGLDPEVISLLFGLSGAVDMLLFYPAGKVMDHWGRLWMAIPSMLLMGVAMALLPLTGGATTVALVACLLGLGNGIGAGIIMTIGADVAPVNDRSSFLGVWRLFSDAGDAAGPLIIAAGAALGSVAGGIWASAAVGAMAAGALGRWVPRYSEHANRTTRRRAER